MFVSYYLLVRALGWLQLVLPKMTIHIERYASAGISCAVAETQGAREEYEDAHVVNVDQQCASMWVLDGHHGASAAQFSGSALTEELGGPVVKGSKLPSDERILQGFRTVDNRLRQYFKSHPDGAKSGSTAVGFLAAQQGDGLFDMKLVNCGDSRGVVLDGSYGFVNDVEASVRSGTAEFVQKGKTEAQTRHKRHHHHHHHQPKSYILETVDHKPANPIERARIEAAGGNIQSCKSGKLHRIDGNLAVSRGFGDFAFKSNRRLSAAEQKVSCSPDVYNVHGLHPGSLVILACDGLWDVMSTEDAAKMVLSKTAAGDAYDLADIANELVEVSLKKKSQDNVTVLLAQLGSLDGSESSSNEST
mmetsp:Transcript_27363/g.63848  ORF Transcript_27363/g.63848 Transcript_27363/m.63848 type:complete len:361 (-) Transcript_27363:58-1140(-)